MKSPPLLIRLAPAQDLPSRKETRMRRLWIRSFALITIGLCGCQNTLDQQPRVISGPPGTSLQGVVSAPLAVPLSAAALGTRTLSTGYKPAGGVSVQVML